MDWILHIEFSLDINCSVDGLHNGHSMPYNKNMFDFFPLQILSFVRSK